MRIGCFGCSFTGGTGGIKDQGSKRYEETAFACWPNELAKLNKNYTVYNFGRGGLSMQGILYFFEQYSKYFDYNIVKITDHARLTCVHPNLKELSKVRKNYYAWDGVEAQKILALSTAGFNENYVQIPWSKEHAKNYHSMWLRHLNNKYEIVQAKAITKYLLGQADFVFKHYESSQGIPLPATDDNITDFEKHAFDGHHLDIYGAHKEAQWIQTIIERKTNV